MRSLFTLLVNRVRYIGRALRVLKDEGAREFLARVAATLSGNTAAMEHLLVSAEDALAVDLSVPHPAVMSPLTVRGRRLNIAWISSPPGRESGGHHNMFRFIKFAIDAGHRSTVYLYDGGHSHVSLAEARSVVESSPSYPDNGPELRMWDPATGVDPDTDVIVATGWETAYPSYLDRSGARRLYFVQDFEPLFYPTGSQALLAENTYRFGFHGVTAGKWLAGKLAREYGMRTTHFDFAADTQTYHLTHEGERSDVFFYARPVTPRRAFELGILVLEKFAELRPEVTIHLAGWDVSHHRVPFPHVNHSSLPLAKLNSLYNQCSTGLVLSLTNLSLLPLELLAAGVTPVVNDAPNNREVTSNENIRWAAPNPSALARALVEAHDDARDGSRAAANAASIDRGGWAVSGQQFVAALESALAE